MPASSFASQFSSRGAMAYPSRVTRVPGPWFRTARAAGLVSPGGEVRPTIFAEMTGLAEAHGAVNLGQGFPDDDAPAAVLDAARDAIAAGTNQYPPGRGTLVLREAIARHQSRFYGIDLDPASEVVVTAGATEAIAATLLALVEPGDEVVVFEPAYDAYAAAAALAGARLVPVPIRWPDFQPDLDELRRAVTDRTRLILVNDPHNPTGAVFDDDTRTALVELATRHDAVLVTDEVYEHLRFDHAHRPLATLPGAAERTLTISSAGKTFSVTGWKIGWVTGPRALVDAVLAVKQYLTFASGAPLQPAVAAGLDLPDAFFAGIADDLRARRDVLVGGLEDAGLAVADSAGSYFVVADAAPLGVTDAAAFCRELPERAGVVAIPVSAFVSERERGSFATLVRFAACRREDAIREASARLRRMA